MKRLASFFAAVFPSWAAAQIPITTAAGQWVGAPVEEYVRVLQLTGVMPLSSRMIRPTDSPTRWLAPDTADWRSPWAAHYGERAISMDSGRLALRVFHPVTEMTRNSAIPYGMNNGAMWAGRGNSVQLTWGGVASMGPWTLQVAPSYSWSENKPFTLATLRFAHPAASPYADQWLSGRIDRPQRFGEKAYSRLDAGQSALWLSARGARLGVSNENMWWGAGEYNALVMTNNAAGFPHAAIGTANPADIWLGRLEVLYSVGTLSQSNYWRTAADTFPTDRWVNSIAIVFEPRGMEGMYFGASRVFTAYQRTTPITLRELATILQTFRKKTLSTPENPSGSDKRDQIAALSFRWVFPQVGFEAYGEWGREDHNWDLRDFAVEPDHSRAYLLGARKVIKFRDGILSLRAEVIDLADVRAADLRGAAFWYTHGRVQQGYTQRGQIMGAGVGTGSDQQTFAADWYHPRGRFGVTVQRLRDNSDSFYLAYNRATPGSFGLHDVYVSAGPRVTLFSGPVEADLLYLVQYEFNRYTTFRNDVRNHHLALRAQVRLP